MPTLDELRSHLDITPDSYTEELQRVLDAATGMVRDWSSEPGVDPDPEVVVVSGGQVMLSTYPIAGVTAVETVDVSTYAGTPVADLSLYPITNAAAGFVRAPHANGTLLRITYTADTTESPQFALAVLEVAAYLWRSRKGGSDTYLPAGEPDVTASPMLGGIKRRALLILADKSKPSTFVA